MATTRSTTAQTEPANQPTPQQIVNEGIALVVNATGIDVQKSRYKAMRAIAWQSFVSAIEAGTFDALLKEAIANVDRLPSGWEIVAPVKPEPIAAAPVNTPVKTAATTTANAPTR
jgi:hypothetical protein